MRKTVSLNYEKTTTWKPTNEGDKLEGVYVRKEEFEYNGKPTVKYVVESNGELYGLYGAALKRQFAQIPEGSYVWIEFTGKASTKNNFTVNTFKVDYDDEYQG